MRKSTYLFEAMDGAGRVVRRCSQRCDGVSAQQRAVGILSATPDAAAVFGFERKGRQVHSAYRD
ncbi:hypothetical protein [Hyphococcus sp.]|uniref:hypothetical protein n=1 Tax=Hyphococcus sp. TaxID=2038636 RepID=UPI003CCBB9FF